MWLAFAFLGIFLLQRFSLPGMPVSLTVPFVFAWAAAAVMLGVAEVDVTRLTVWLVAAGCSALVMVPQALLLAMPLISVSSWLLWMVTWLPMVLRFTDRSPGAHQAAMRALSRCGVAVATLAMLFMGLQFAGVPYRDFVAEHAPSNLLLEGYVITYPIVWNSPIQKANAWFALEPSFLSFMLGLALVAALVARRGVLVVAWIAVGILCTTAGSGLAVVGAYLAAVILRGRGAFLWKYSVLGLVLAVVAASTQLGTSILDRVGEAGDTRSSTTLRMIEPYQHLVPRWLSDPALTLVGGGPGSSQRVVSDLGILGLLVPTPAKMLYDYGFFVGLLLLAMIILTFLRSRAPELAFSLAASLLTLQAAAQPLVALSLLTVTLFSPVTRLDPRVGAGNRRYMIRSGVN